MELLDGIHLDVFAGGWFRMPSFNLVLWMDRSSRGHEVLTLWRRFLNGVWTSTKCII